MPLSIQIPLSEGAPLPSFDMQVPLEGITYTLQIRWNVRWNAWFLSVLDADGLNYFVAGVRLVANWPLAAYRANRQPPGALIVEDTAGFGEDPTLDSLGVRHVLVYFTTTELGL